MVAGEAGGSDWYPLEFHYGIPLFSLEINRQARKIPALQRLPRFTTQFNSTKPAGLEFPLRFAATPRPFSPLDRAATADAVESRCSLSLHLSGCRRYATGSSSAVCSAPTCSRSTRYSAR